MGCVCSHHQPNDRQAAAASGSDCANVATILQRPTDESSKNLKMSPSKEAHNEQNESAIRINLPRAQQPVRRASFFAWLFKGNQKRARLGVLGQAPKINAVCDEFERANQLRCLNADYEKRKRRRKGRRTSLAAVGQIEAANTTKSGDQFHLEEERKFQEISNKKLKLPHTSANMGRSSPDAQNSSSTPVSSSSKLRSSPAAAADRFSFSGNSNYGTHKRDKTQTTALDQAQYKEINTSNSRPNSMTFNETATGEVILFTSVQQLCYEIIKRILLRPAKMLHPGAPGEGKVLCLFMFGCQGSSKGELAFELAQHSALSRALKLGTSFSLTSCSPDGDTGANPDSDCPLYHYLDVASIIAANIDARIRHYNQLVARTCRNRRDQLANLNKTNSPAEQGDKTTTNEPANDYLKSDKSMSDNSAVLGDSRNTGEANSLLEDESRQKEIGDDLDEDDCEDVKADQDLNSFGSNDISSLSSDLLSSRQMSLLAEDDFDLMTLSTKQRSILQLKLMKYYNSVTSKWIFDLIQAEVDKLEAQYRQQVKSFLTFDQDQATDETIASNTRRLARDRVYLINLVPNQLNLFKSCLYLQQDMLIKGFHYHYWAIKFERRTNIKLLKKERVSTKQQQQQVGAQSNSLSGGSSKSPLRIRLPILGSKFSSGDQTTKGAANRAGNNKSSEALAVVATNLVVESVNEKLGPKFNENFSQQFKSMRRLIQVRYNQTRDDNYAHYHDYQEVEASHEHWRLLSTSWLARPACSELLAARFRLREPSPERCWSDSGRPTYHRTGGGEQLPRADPLVANSSEQNLHYGGATLRPDATTHRRDRTADRRQHQGQGSSLSSVSSNESESRSKGELGSRCDRLSSPRLSSRGSLVISAPSLISAAEHDTSTRGRSPRGPAVPCAIELELYDSSAPSRLRSATHIVSDLPASGEVDHESGSSLFNAASSGHHSRSAWSRQHYRLVPVRIAYANERSQVMLEVRHEHPRQVKLKSHADLARLLKLIFKLRAQLVSDCETWLADSLAGTSRHLMLASDHLPAATHSGGGHKLVPQAGSGQSLSFRHHLKRHSVTHSSSSQALATPTAYHHSSPSAGSGHLAQSSDLSPPLVVQTIRLDIHRICSGQFQYPANFEPPIVNEKKVTNIENLSPSEGESHGKKLVPILKLNDGDMSGSLGPHTDRTSGSCRRAKSAEPGLPGPASIYKDGPGRPGSSQSAAREPVPACKQAKRHVQFKLSQAPGPPGSSSASIWSTQNERGQLIEPLAALRAQQRRWLNTWLFVSSMAQSRAGSPSDLLEAGSPQALDLVTALVEQHIGAHLRPAPP